MIRLRQLMQSIDACFTHLGEKLEGKQMRFYPSLVGPILFLLMGIAGFLIMPFQVKKQEGMATTARTFPSLLLWVIVGGAILLLLQEIAKIIRKQPIQVVYLDLLTEIKAVVILALLVLYALLIPVLGFIITSILFGIGMLVFFRIRKWNYYVIVTIAALSIGLLFQVVLNVRLP
nr:tripartite tricarboxylate transporter TctB family protein [uncultured Sphaerochaeta sp.]